MSQSMLTKQLPVRVLILAGLILATGANVQAQGRGGGGGAHAGGAPGAPGAGFGAPRSFAPASQPMPAPAHAMPAATVSQAQPVARGDRPAADRSAAAPAQQLANDMKALNQAAFNDRKALLESADMSLAASREALQKIQTDTRTLRADAREKFQVALADVKARDAELAETIKGAQSTDAPGWDKAREKLAAAHQHYADALARLEEARRNGEAPGGG